MRRLSVLLFALLVLNCFSCSPSIAQLLPEDEVKILDTIASKLQNRNWRPNQRSCQENQFLDRTISETRNSSIKCNCTFDNNNTCHITNILLKGENLKGVLPTEFLNLIHLQEIDLSRNYISGSIPASFGQFRRLRILALLGNRINGSIPSEISNISTLEELVLEGNQLGGPLPQSLGKLSSLKRLLLSANNFTGKIPETFVNLKNLEDFRIDGSPLSGKIPDLIGKWTKIKELHLQGTSMEGPIPSTISQLKNLRLLMISDLKGSNMPFPPLQDMASMKTLILRNCLIADKIQHYIGDMTDLKTLDLSFNQLTGPIPPSIKNLNINFLFLNNNSLSGELPSWIQTSRDNIDVSYNNFTISSPADCSQSIVNLVSSASSSVSSDKSVAWCMKKDLPCPRKPRYYSLFINCGGPIMNFEGNDYEEDQTRVDGSSYFHSSEKWAYSTTGLFMGNGKADYVIGNNFNLNITGADFYKTARGAPTSLKYYGLCLRKGSYTVRLHFAELMFSNDSTFSSLGKRIFDVELQGNVVLKDFNIVEKAKGVGKGIFEEFSDIHVDGSTLKIHLYWAGKGTTSLPTRGVYGPLISAITVTPNFNVDSGGLSIGAIIGIVVGSCVIILLILIVLRMKGYLGGNVEDPELRALELQTGYFTLRQMKAATRNFDPAYKIGEGGFGPVYKGVLSDSTVIAVKQLSSKSKQGNREFVNEIGMISALQHPNLVKLYGCCVEGNQLLLVYEYMENNSLARALFGHEEQRLNLDWSTRKKICMGIARGLAYLHEESRLKIVHRDIKATNVLLDKDLNAKISDFGLAKLDEDENTHISTRIAGTIGYMAPEYAMRGYLTDKADVYSFGIVVLEIVSGKSNTNYRPKEEFVYLLDWAYVLQEQGNLLELVDPSLGSSYSQKEATRMLNLALLCTNPSPTLRPSMSSVVSMLEGKVEVQVPLVKRNAANEDLRFKAFEKLSQDSQTHFTTSSQYSQISNDVSKDGPWIDSSVYAESKDGSIGQCSTSKLLIDI